MIAALATGCLTPKAPAPFDPAGLAAWRAEREQTAHPADWAFDVDSAIAYAKAHGPDVLLAEDQAAVADAGIGAAGQLQNPQVRVGRRTDEGVLGDASRYQVAVLVHPDMPWLVSARVEQARAEAAATRASSRVTVAQRAGQIRALYVDLAYAAADREALQRGLALLEQRQAVRAEQVTHGMATSLDLLDAERDTADARDALGANTVASETARVQLARLLGLPASQPWTPVLDDANFRRITPAPDTETLARTALAARPELEAATARARAAGAAARQERMKRVPWLDWIQVERATQHDEDKAEWGLSASVVVPIFSQNRGRIEAADAAVHAQLDARSELAAALTTDLANAAALVDATAARASALQAANEPWAKELAAVLAQPASATATALVDLLRLQVRAITAERALLAALHDHARARVALAIAAGTAQ